MARQDNGQKTDESNTQLTIKYRNVTIDQQEPSKTLGVKLECSIMVSSSCTHRSKKTTECDGNERVVMCNPI